MQHRFAQPQHLVAILLPSPSASTADRSPRSADAARASLGPCSPIRARALPSATADPNTSGETTSASAFDSARLSVNVFDRFARRAKAACAAPRFAKATSPRSLSCPHFQFWILTKNYFPLPPAREPTQTHQQQVESRDCERRLSSRQLSTRNSSILNYFVTFAVCEPCFLKIRVGENSPSLWPTMFSVTNTE